MENEYGVQFEESVQVEPRSKPDQFQLIFFPIDFFFNNSFNRECLWQEKNGLPSVWERPTVRDWAARRRPMRRSSVEWRPESWWRRSSVPSSRMKTTVKNKRWCQQWQFSQRRFDFSPFVGYSCPSWRDWPWWSVRCWDRTRPAPCPSRGHRAPDSPASCRDDRRPLQKERTNKSGKKKSSTKSRNIWGKKIIDSFAGISHEGFFLSRSRVCVVLLKGGGVLLKISTIEKMLDENSSRNYLKSGPRNWKSATWVWTGMHVQGVEEVTGWLIDWTNRSIQQCRLIIRTWSELFLWRNFRVSSLKKVENNRKNTY